MPHKLPLTHDHARKHRQFEFCHPRWRGLHGPAPGAILSSARSRSARLYDEPARGGSSDIAALTKVVRLSHLIGHADPHFEQSDLVVLHYPGRYPLVDSIKGIDHGAAVFYYHNVTPPELWDNPEGRLGLHHSIDSAGPLACYADLVVTPSQFNADQLAGQGCDRDRIRVPRRRCR